MSKFWSRKYFEFVKEENNRRVFDANRLAKYHIESIHCNCNNKKLYLCYMKSLYDIVNTLDSGDSILCSISKVINRIKSKIKKTNNNIYKVI